MAVPPPLSSVIGSAPPTTTIMIAPDPSSHTAPHDRPGPDDAAHPGDHAEAKRRFLRDAATSVATSFEPALVIECTRDGKATVRAGSTSTVTSRSASRAASAASDSSIARPSAPIPADAPASPPEQHHS